MGRRCILNNNCQSGKYAVFVNNSGITSTECVPCRNFDCEMCDQTQPSVCISCKRNWIKPLLMNGQCVASCAVGQYHSPAGVCASCDATCATCDGPGSCLSCSVGGGTPYMHNGQCVSMCPVGFSRDNSTMTCQPCHPTCSTCTAPADASRCITCLASSSTPFKAYQVAVGNCSTFCPLGQFGDTAAGSCAPCPSNCKACTNSTHCTECVSNFNTVLNGVCVDKPPPAVGTSAGASQLGDLATLARQSAASGGLDTGYPVTGVGLQEPLIPQARAANNVSYPSTPEIQRVILVGRLWTLAPPLPPPQ